MWNELTRFLNKKLFQIAACFFPPVPKSVPKNPNLILVFSTTGIGDGLFDSAAIKSLKKAYPAATMVVATHHRRSSVARHNPFVDEVLLLSKSPFSQAKLLWHFRKKKPDIIVALRVNEEAVPLGYLLNRHAFFGAVERCQQMAFLLSHPIITKNEPHIVEETLRVAEAAGGAMVDRGMIYDVQKEEKEKCFQKFSQLQKPYIVFQTGGGATMSWRNWPTASYIQAINWIHEHYPHQIVLTGGHDNQATAIAIKAACPWVINTVEKTTLEETAALLSEANLLVSTDTGVMHLGFAIGCPTLALLHYKSPASMYGPLDYTPGHQIIELHKQKNMPYEDEMSEIPFNQVQEAMQRILSISKQDSRGL